MRSSSERFLQKKEYSEPFIPLPTTGTGRKKIVILVPGIQTNGDWIDNLARNSDLYSIDARKAFGGDITWIDLLTRCWLRDIRQEIQNQIISIVSNNPTDEISLICHSMGTDIIASIIEPFGKRFEYIFFIGSICKETSAARIANCCQLFVNHRGTHDGWPILASIFRPAFYSPTGVYGFNQGAYMTDVLLNNDHHKCTAEEHLYQYIIPTIALNERVVRRPDCEILHIYPRDQYMLWKRLVRCVAPAGGLLTGGILAFFNFGWLLIGLGALAVPTFTAIACAYVYSERKSS